MAGTTAKVFVYAKALKGRPELSNFKLIEEQLAALKDGEFLAEATFISVDPYLRSAIVNIPIGKQIVGRQVARFVKR